MTRKKSSPKAREKKAGTTTRRKDTGTRARQAPAPETSEEALQGPPPIEAVGEPSDLQRRFDDEIEEYHGETSPKLSGGDVDADWQRADSDGEETVGGTVATPDQDVVDELGDALGVSRNLAEEVRGSAEILDERDAKRQRMEG